MAKEKCDVVTVRELYRLLEDLKDNHIGHLNERITKLEQKVWFATGGLAVLSFVLKFFFK